jgi:hypothetical protein
MAELKLSTPRCPNDLGILTFLGPFGGSPPYTYEIYVQSSLNPVTACDENYTSFIFKVETPTPPDTITGGIRIDCGAIKYFPELNLGQFAPHPTASYATGRDFALALKSYIENVTNPALIALGYKPMSILFVDDVSLPSPIITLMVDKNIAGCCATLTTSISPSSLVTLPYKELVSCCPPIYVQPKDLLSNITPITPPPGYLYVSSVTTVGSNTEYSTTLRPGIYIIQIRDANNNVSPFTIVVPNPLIPPCGGVISHESCYQKKDGTITLNPILNYGENPSFRWTGPNGFISNDKDITNLEPGTYNLTITSPVGCKSTCTYTILEASELSAVVNVLPPECPSCTDKITVEIVVTGGSERCKDCDNSPTGYKYKIDPIMDEYEELPTNPFYIDTFTEGLYRLWIKDCNCCSTSTAFQVKPHILTFNI